MAGYGDARKKLRTVGEPLVVFVVPLWQRSAEPGAPDWRLDDGRQRMVFHLSLGHPVLIGECGSNEHDHADAHCNNDIEKTHWPPPSDHAPYQSCVRTRLR